MSNIIFKLIGITIIAGSIVFQKYLSELGNWQSMVGWFIFWGVLNVFMEWRDYE